MPLSEQEIVRREKLDKGCGSIVIVFILTLLGWIPGVIAALIILNNPNR